MNRLTLGLIVVLAISLAVSMRQCSSYRDSSEDYSSLYRSEHVANEVWKTESGKWRNKAEAANLSASTLKDLVNNSDKNFKDLSKRFDGLDKKLKNLNSVSTTSSRTRSRVSARGKDTVFITVRKRDTIRISGKKFEWSDSSGFNSFRGMVVGDSLRGNFMSTDSLEMVTYWERKWMLGEKKYFTEVESKNPNTKVVYNKSVVVRPKRRRRLFGLL